MTTPGALEAIERLARAAGGDLLVGAGSVLDGETARRAVEAGARYVVSPVFRAEVVDEAHRQGAAALPGAFTPTEILDAHEAGADVVKVFPADPLGPAFIRGRAGPHALPAAGPHRRRHARERGGVAPRRRRRRGAGQRAGGPPAGGRGGLGGADGARPPAGRRGGGGARRRGCPVKRVVTFGELMLRLSPPGHERLFQSPQLRTFFGGSEANVAASLAHFGVRSDYVTRVPAGAVGDAAVAALRAEGVGVRGIVRGGDRLGIYFVESGADLRAMRVVYDRAGSALSRLDPAELDWERLLAGADWLHVSGITPALGEGPAPPPAKPWPPRARWASGSASTSTTAPPCGRGATPCPWRASWSATARC